jgi:hypothetical protein
VLAGGIALGVHVYTAGRYRVTLFGEAGFAADVPMPDKAFGGDSYTCKPLSLGVAVRF